MLLGVPHCQVWEESKHRPVWVLGASRGLVVILEAVRAPGYGPGPAREGLVVQPGVRYRPVQVLPGQSFPPELAVVRDPPLPLIVPLRPHNCRLIGKEFWGLVGEAGSQECRHH